MSLTPPFKSLVTRTGAAIGRAAERKMLNATGELGFVKKFRRNPDGSTTMLKTKGGMPRFYTSGVAANTPLFTITSSSCTNGSGQVSHHMNKLVYTPTSGPFKFKMWIKSKSPGTFTISGFSEETFSISGDTVTVRADYHFLWYGFDVTVDYSGVSGDPGQIAYELHAGLTRGKNSDVATATIYPS